MAKRYQFTRTVVVDGKRFDAGSVVYDSAVPPGYLESCLQVGHVVELKPGDQAAAEFEKAMTAGPDPRDEEIKRLREELAAARAAAVPPVDPEQPPPADPNAEPPKQPDHGKKPPKK